MRLKEDKVLSLLGLAMKAGRLVSGGFSTEKAVKSQKAFLVIVSQDASDNTKKQFRDMCTYYEVPLYFYGERECLGHAIGKELRTSLALLDDGFAKAVEKQLMTQQT